MGSGLPPPPNCDAACIAKWYADQITTAERLISMANQAKHYWECTIANPSECLIPSGLLKEGRSLIQEGDKIRADVNTMKDHFRSAIGYNPIKQLPSQE